MILLAACGGTGSAVLPEGPLPGRPAAKATAEGGAPPAPTAPAPPVGPGVLDLPSAGDRPLAWLGDRPVRQHQVFDYLLRQDPMQAMQTLNGMLAELLAAKVAREAGITVPAAEVERLLAREIERDRREARRRLGPKADFEEFVALRYGKSLADYRVWMRRTVSRQLLKWYAMVYRAMGEDRCVCRLIAVADRALAVRIREQVVAGADFQVLAAKHSLHPTASQGGRLTPLSRDSGHPLAERIFAMREGEVSEPIPGPLGDRKVWSLIQLEKRLAGRQRPYAEVAGEVARGVRPRPPGLDEALSFFFSARARLGLRLVDPETTNGAHGREGPQRLP